VIITNLHHKTFVFRFWIVIVNRNTNSRDYNSRPLDVEFLSMFQ